jgi:hypothetical protein
MSAEQAADLVFQDFEARSDIVGLYDLALRVVKENPKLWAEISGFCSSDLPDQQL